MTTTRAAASRAAQAASQPSSSTLGTSTLFAPVSEPQTWREAAACVNRILSIHSGYEEPFLPIQRLLSSLIERIEILEATLQTTPVPQQLDPSLGNLNAKIAKIDEQLAAHQASIAAASAVQHRTYAAVTAAPAFERFRLSPMQPCKILASHDDAVQASMQALKLMDMELVKPAELRMQHSKPVGDVSVQGSMRPTSVLLGFLPTDAHTLKKALWDTANQEKLKADGWRISRVLPPQEFGNKQALWKAHGPTMRAWVQAGKRLLYSRRYTQVTAEGLDAALLTLP